MFIQNENFTKNDRHAMQKLPPPPWCLLIPLTSDFCLQKIYKTDISTADVGDLSIKIDLNNTMAILTILSYFWQWSVCLTR